jgi:hypothetical protein
MDKIALVTLTTALLCGCASNPTPHTYTGKDGVTYHEDKDIQGVWMADGFDFNGYDTVFVAEPTSDAESRSEDEKKVLQTAKRMLRQELIATLEEIQVFKRVVQSTNDIPAGSKVLRLENNIYHHEKGGGGARFFAGLYGAGQPVIKVLGKMSEDEKPLFRYDMTRSGESGGARMGGVYMSDESIQTEDIRDLARDLATFIKNTATHTPRK